MNYSEHEIEELLSKIDILEVINQYVSVSERNGKWFGLCPLHAETSPSFMIDKDKQKYYCFGCGSGGNVINFLMDYHHISFAEAVRMLKKENLKSVKSPCEEKKKILEMNLAAVALYKKNLYHNQQAKTYLEKRKLSEETIEKFQIGFSNEDKTSLYEHLVSKGFKDDDIKTSGLVSFYDNGYIADKFTGRLMFPIQNVNGTVIGFGGRILSDRSKKDAKAAPKYLNSPETEVFDKSGNLFGLNIAKDTKEDFFIICEGYMDAISMHQAGFTNAIASLGTSFTSNHAKLISKFKNKVYLAYDSDGPGINAAKKAIQVLEPFGIEIRFINAEPYKDPDEFIKILGSKAYVERIESALSKEQWLFVQALKTKDYGLIIN